MSIEKDENKCVLVKRTGQYQVKNKKDQRKIEISNLETLGIQIIEIAKIELPGGQIRFMLFTDLPN